MGKDEPTLNTINDVFHQHDIDWGVSVTHKFGDATEFACQAATEGFDIVAGYGGNDGYFIQRLNVGIEPKEQTTRESKDKYGTSAYAIDSFHRAQHIKGRRFGQFIDCR